MVSDGDIPVSSGSPFGQVQALLAVGQVQRALDLARSMVAADPANPNAMIVLSMVHRRRSDADAAIDAAREAVRLAPDNDAPHHQLALSLFQKGRFSEAEASMLRALELDPHFAPYHEILARMLTSCTRFVPALRAVERALELDPELPTAHELRAQLLLAVHHKHWSLSEEAARRALQLDPGDPDAHAVMGQLMLRARRAGEAEARFREALRLEPGNALALSGLAEVVMGRRWYYRPFLRFSSWISARGLGTAVAVILGAWVVYSALSGMMAGRAEYATLDQALTVAYLGLCAYTWFATPVTRWILAREFPWLREATP